jgi:hypothetical protein
MLTSEDYRVRCAWRRGGVKDAGVGLSDEGRHPAG